MFDLIRFRPSDLIILPYYQQGCGSGLNCTDSVPEKNCTGSDLIKKTRIRPEIDKYNFGLGSDPAKNLYIRSRIDQRPDSDPQPWLPDVVGIIRFYQHIYSYISYIIFVYILQSIPIHTLRRYNKKVEQKCSLTCLVLLLVLLPIFIWI